MIPVDKTGSVLVMHRSGKVRSARNVWSFPSGLHEVGNLIDDEAKRELHEEYELPVIGTRHIGVYENVAGDADAEEQYHWVITLVAALVACPVSCAVNREPDKHDDMKVIPIDAFNIEFLAKHPFHSSFHEYAYKHSAHIRDVLRRAKDDLVYAI